MQALAPATHGDDCTPGIHIFHVETATGPRLLFANAQEGSPPPPPVPEREKPDRSVQRAELILEKRLVTLVHSQPEKNLCQLW